MEKYKAHAEEYFKNHVATLKIIDGDTQILTWKNPSSIYYSIEFIFRGNMIFVSGDMGNAVFDCTWNPTWDYKWEKTFPGYFAEKCKLITDGKEDWSGRDALEDIKEGFRDRFEMLDDKNYDILFEKVKSEQYVPFPNYTDMWDIDQEPLPFTDIVNSDGLLLDLCLAVSAAHSCYTQREFAETLKHDISLSHHYNIDAWGIRGNSRIPLFLWALRMAKEQLAKKEQEGV